MAVEFRPVSGDGLGSLQGCLVGGDPEQREREGRLRRKSLILSVTVQGVLIAAIVLIPLLGKPARIALANVCPSATVLFACGAASHGPEQAATSEPEAQCLPDLCAHIDPDDDRDAYGADR